MASHRDQVHIDNIVRPPNPFIRQSRRSSLLNFSTPSRHRRVGTLKFEELDHTQPRYGSNKEGPLTRELSYDSVTSTRAVNRFSNIGLFLHLRALFWRWSLCIGSPMTVLPCSEPSSHCHRTLRPSSSTSQLPDWCSLRHGAARLRQCCSEA